MKVEFIFHNKGNRFDAKEIKDYLETLIKGPKRVQPFPAEIVSITNMSKWLVILIDFPTLTKHERTIIPGRREEDWWETLAGYLVLQYDVVFLHWEVHEETRSLIYKQEWGRKKSQH